MSVKRNARTGAWESRWRQNGRQRSRSFATQKLATKHDLLTSELLHAGHLDGLALERAADGEGWEVRWNDQRLDRHRRPFATKKDALEFERVIIESRRLGRPTDQIDVGTQTVGEYMVDVWTPQHFVYLQPNSQRIYRALWRRHLRDTFEDLPLRDVTASVIRRWQQDRVATGAGLTSVNQALVLLGGILQRAFQDEQIPTNPARIVTKLRTPKTETVKPLSPTVVELVRFHALDHFDETLMSVLAYAGLRPSEAWALQWGDLQERTLLIERATDGEGGVKTTKTSRARTVKLLGPLVQDLAQWRIAQGRPYGYELIFPSKRHSGVANMDEQAAWRRHRWGKAWKSAAAENPTMSGKPPKVYALRHSFVSLLLASGRQPHYVATQLGHDASQTISTYGHVIDEYAAGDGAERIDPEVKIREARDAACATRVRPAQVAGGAA